MDRTDAIAVFIAVADHGSFAAAARRLGRSPASVTRAVADLESRLGVRLLTRTTRAVSTTEAGQRFLGGAKRVLADLDEIERAAAGQGTAPRGELRLTAPILFGRLHVAPVLSGQAILTFAGKEQGITLNGILPEVMAGVSDIDDKIVAGSLDAVSANPNGIIIGRGLARKLYLAMGDNVSVSSPIGQVRTMKIVGLFDTGTTAIDEGQAFILLKRAQALFGRVERANKLIIQLDDPYAARDISAVIESHVGYRAESWQEAQQSLMSVLLIRNIIMYSVVSAILVVASFGIFNVISTVVLEKRRDVAILNSMGFHARDVRRIFLAQGVVIGGLGSVLGIALGYALMLLLGAVKVQPPGLSEAVNLPLYWGADQLLIAAIFAVLSAAGAAYIPARRAGRVHPVDILRGGMA